MVRSFLMGKKQKQLGALLGSCLLVGLVLWPAPADAIPPPDFLFAAGWTLGTVFSIFALLFSGVLALCLRLLQPLHMIWKRKRRLVVLFIILAAVLSLAGAFFWSNWQSVRRQEQRSAAAEGVFRARVQAQQDPADVNVVLTEREKGNLAITNADFAAVDLTKAFVLDAREDEEFAIGSFPGSVHIRFADLLDGSWKRVWGDWTVYVICWSGIRGKEVAEFLESKGVSVRYLEEGADGWVKSGGRWEGEISFSSHYTDPALKKLFTTQELKEQMRDVLLVDVRDPAVQKQAPLAKTVPASIIFTPNKDIPVVLARLAQDARVIAICDSFVNCFDAKILGVRLQKRGTVFLGRYASPWEL